MYDKKANIINAPYLTAFFPYGLSDKPVIYGANIFIQMYIYIITHPKFEGWLKVGKAKNVFTRLMAYQTSCPDRSFNLAFYRETENPKRIEKYFKENVTGKGAEWFNCSLGYAIDLINGLLDDPNYSQSNIKNKKQISIRKIKNTMVFSLYYVIDDSFTMTTLKDVVYYTGSSQSYLSKLFNKGKDSIFINGHKIKRYKRIT